MARAGRRSEEVRVEGLLMRSRARAEGAEERKMR